MRSALQMTLKFTLPSPRLSHTLATKSRVAPPGEWRPPSPHPSTMLEARRGEAHDEGGAVWGRATLPRSGLCVNCTILNLQ